MASTTATSHDGVELRPARDEDAPALTSFLAELSAETAFRRFRQPLPRVPAWLTRRLLVTDADRGAWLARQCGRPANAGSLLGPEGPVVGHAVWGRLPGDGEAVDVGVVVADSAQGRGVGRALTQHAVAQAVASGARRLELALQPEDRRLLGAATRTWPTASITSERGVTVLRVALAP